MTHALQVTSSAICRGGHMARSFRIKPCTLKLNLTNTLIVTEKEHPLSSKFETLGVASIKLAWDLLWQCSKIDVKQSYFIPVAEKHRSINHSYFTKIYKPSSTPRSTVWAFETAAKVRRKGKIERRFLWPNTGAEIQNKNA